MTRPVPHDVHGFGRLRKPDARDQKFGLTRALLLLTTRTAPVVRPVVVPPEKTWRLYRRDQLDQGDTPQCVTHTGKHWEKSLPLNASSGLTAAMLYERCKQKDGDTQDGTDARSLLQVYQDLKLVGNYWWDDGDDEAVALWVLTQGPLWWGAFWSRPMMTTKPGGRMDVRGDLRYGHEVLIDGYSRRTKLYTIVNSWGLDGFGVEGRGTIHRDELRSVTNDGGDLVGVTQQLLETT